MYEARGLPFHLFACCRKFHCASKETLRTTIKEVRGKPPTAKERGQRRLRAEKCVFERLSPDPISGQGEQVGNEHNLNRAISPVEWERFWYLLTRVKRYSFGRRKPNETFL